MADAPTPPEDQPPLPNMSRREMQVLRAAVEAGTYPVVDGQELLAVKAELLRIMKTSTSQKVKLAAIRTHTALQRHNLQTLMVLCRIDQGDPPVANDDIELPGGGPWGGENIETDVTDEAEDKAI